MIQNEDKYIVEQAKSDKLAQAWSRMVDCICHDLTSPLVSIRTSGEPLPLITKLIEGYKTAARAGLIQSDIDAKELIILERLAPDIPHTVTKIMRFLEVLHPYNKQLISKSEDIQVLSALASINHLLNNYQFDNPDERSLIHVDCQQDFKFKCAPLFIESLLDNLLRNALLYIKRTGKGEIRIWTELTQNGNSIHFKDTADGMDDFAVLSVFKRFFSKRNEKTVPGLGFCRLAILQLDGDVLCESVRGEYTHFTVKFPCYQETRLEPDYKNAKMHHLF